MYGRSDTEPDEVLEKKLKAQAAWIQTFRNISVYDAAGAYDGDRVCVVQYDVDFRRTDTLAPGIMYFYAERAADGGYIFLENLIKERVDYLEAELESPNVKSMIEDTDSRLKEALDSDSELALIYTSFRNGEIYKESNLDIDREQEVDLFLDPEDSILVEGATLPALEETADSADVAERGAVDDLLVVVAQAAPCLDGFGGRVDLLIIRRGLRRRDGGGLRRGRRLGVDPAGLGAFSGRSGRLDGDRGQGLLDGGLIDLGIGDHVLRDAVHPVERRRHVQPALAAGEGVGVPGADAVEEVAAHKRFDREFRELRQSALLAHRLGRAQREDQRDDAEGEEHREKGRGEPAAAGAEALVLLP